MKRIYETVIVDDEDMDMEALEASLSEYPQICVVGTAKSLAAGKKLILAKCPELLFLDVELPGGTGFDLLKELEGAITWNMQVIFYTSYEKYLLDALRQSAFDYLLKPYTKEDFQKVMDRYFQLVVNVDHGPVFGDSVSRLLPNSHTFMISTITGYQLLRLEHIGYFEHRKDDRQWSVVLYNQTRMQLRRTTKAEDILRFSPSFVQVNQQVIININYLTLIDGKMCVFDPPFDRRRDIQISRLYFKELLERFNCM